MRRFLAAALIATCVAVPAFAQEDTDVLADKINRLERDISFLQKQVYRGKDSGGAGGAVGGAGVENRLVQLTEDIRQLRGTVEQIQFSNRQLATDMKKLQEDSEYRFRALEDKQAAAAAAAATAAANATAAEAPATPAKFEPEAPAKESKPAATGNDYPNANEHYSHAFKLLNEKKYAEASTSFDQFVKKYPGDPLTANAFYWLGESYYARGDFTRSAESFRKGFEAGPDGQKAPDNLFKLAKSLAQVKRVTEACVVLGQVSTKYADISPRIAKRAEEERIVQQCK